MEIYPDYGGGKTKPIKANLPAVGGKPEPVN